MLLGGAGESGYNLTRSLRFRASASANMVRTPASAGDRQKFTYSGWIKRGNISSGSTNNTLISTNEASAPWAVISFNADNTIQVSFTAGISPGTFTSAVFRDPSAWYHIVVAVDTTQATAANRIKIYVNGVLQAIGTANYPALNANTQFNDTVIHRVGGYSGAFFDGYMADVYWIDGQALTPSSFGSTNALTGVWQPAAYTGTYGTNGFYLKFTDNSTAAALGTDFSGNSNTWTVNNISVTAGVTYDSMTDVPTLTDATSSNYCVGNPLSVGPNASLSSGNLSGALTGSGGWSATICGLTSGKWYYEAVRTASTGNSAWIGFLSDAYTNNDNAWSFSTQAALYANDARNGNNAAYGATWTTNDIIGVALDLSSSSGSITFYKNGVSQGVMFSSLTSSARWRPLISGGGGGSTIQMNFGQRPFAYTPPTGFVALNTFNLPAATIVKGNTVMDATLYTGNGSTQTITNAAGFQPDLVWVKGRSTSARNRLFNVLSGVQKELYSDLTNAESTDANGIQSFNSNGFTLGSNDANTNTTTYVGWQWQAGQGSSSSNTAGSITSTVSVNASAGFSVVTYTGTGANATVGHGLGVAPKLIICKARSTTGSWQTYHSALTGTTGIFLDLTSASFASSVYWNNTNPTSSVFSIGTSSFVNVASQTQVAYCWSEIDGFSKFGSYTGNGSADGTFVYTGFRPKFVLLKMSSATSSWFIRDTERDTYNASTKSLFPNLSDAENPSGAALDILSNGFKLRSTTSGVNGSGETIIYAAYAESPFRNSLAR
jgi:hypothetical protein